MNVSFLRLGPTKNRFQILGFDGEGKVACRDRLIGLLRFYDREAA